MRNAILRNPPPRGCVYGLLLVTPFWVALGVLVWLLLR